MRENGAQDKNKNGYRNPSHKLEINNQEYSDAYISLEDDQRSSSNISSEAQLRGAISDRRKQSISKQQLLSAY